jgi:hypothetical protein
MITPSDTLKSNLIERSGVATWPRIAGEVASLLYIALIATIASVTGAFYVMFPELGALSHDVYTRPQGTWARNPLMIAITPVLTGIVGSVFTHLLPYGFLSVLLTVGVSIAIIEVLKSPVAPAISAGLLPVVVDIRSWWYGPGILLGCALLAVLSIPWKRFIKSRTEPVKPSEISEDHLADELERVPPDYGWLVPLIGFVAVATFFVEMTGLRFILFPPLVVIGFEMFGHTSLCPWAQRPMWLPLACFLTAAGGLLFWRLFGVGPLTAGCGMAWGILVLRLLDLHVPPALAVALLPLVMDHPTIAYPFSVGIGTLMMTLWFLFYQSRFAKTGRITRA